MMQSFTGIAASEGIAIAKAYLLVEPTWEITQKTISSVDEELETLNNAVSRSESDLARLKEKISAEQGDEAGLIFEAHITMLNDPEFIGSVREKISGEKINAEYALKQVSEMYITMFESMDDAYMRERAADIKDIARRVTSYLLNEPLTDLSLIDEETIVVAVDLTPSDTAQLNKNFVKGFVTNIGGRTSHSAIMARSMEIPAIVGTKQATTTITNGEVMIVDGFTGTVIVNPSEEQITAYKEKQAGYLAQKNEWAKLVNEKSISADGHQVELAANIGSPSDLENVLKNGAEGVGLYRTEFLYMESDECPSEEMQYEAYKQVLAGLEGKPVIVRTLDIGGDKHLPYLHTEEELNPFLGVRAIRLCLENEELFRTQLRALLRASVHGNLKIMFPMIAMIEEFRKGKAILLEEKATLLDQGIPVSETIEIGIMVEIPATAILADQFAQEVDFFSIGTNDLIQYTMAADRMNEKVSYLYQPYNPAILRLIKMVIDAAHKAGKWAGMCGEMAGEELATPLLLGLGLDEFSMSASSILRTRSNLKKLSAADMKVLAEKALQMQTSEEVIDLLQQTI